MLRQLSTLKKTKKFAQSSFVVRVYHRSWQQRLPQEFLMTVKVPCGRSALQASLFATEGDGTHERGTSMPLNSRLGILLVVVSPAFSGSLPCKRY